MKEREIKRERICNCRCVGINNFCKHFFCENFLLTEMVSELLNIYICNHFRRDGMSVPSYRARHLTASFERGAPNGLSRVVLLWPRLRAGVFGTLDRRKNRSAEHLVEHGNLDGGRRKGGVSS